MNKHIIFIFISMLIAQPKPPQTLEDLKRKATQNIKKNQNIKEFEIELRQGQTLERNGLPDDAERIYKNVLNQDPGYTRAFTKLRGLLKNQNRFDELIELADQYVSVRPKDYMVLIDQIEIYIWAEDDRWNGIAQKVLHSNLKNEHTLKSLISKIISNGFVDDALTFIDVVRTKNNHPDFYASELGTYFRMRMAFDKSLENYLLFLEHNPKKYQMVSSRVMSFPTDEFVVVKLRGILQNSTVDGSKLLLSDVEFRAGNFKISYDLLKVHYTKPGQLLQFAQHATNAKAFDIALTVYTNIIDSDYKNDIIRTAIYGMAQTLETQSIKTESLLPLSRFFDGNEFFESPYYSVEESLLPSLWKAVNIYDSLRIKDGNLDATFRLAEIKFRAMNDLDGAFSLYEKVAQKAPKKDIRFLAALRIIDINLAKGNTEKALAQINSFKRNFKKGDEKLILKIKESQINFYAGNFQSAGDSLIQVLKDLPKDAPRYNDLLDVQSIILAFTDEDESFANFAQVQLLIRQNKRTHALEILSTQMEVQNNFIKDISLYQTAYIHILQNEFDVATQKLILVSGETIFSEMSMILHAEILDFMVGDVGAAIDIYLQFLEDYPLSIYYDDIRIRLRELAS
ncbi:MAG: tetratricopeptide repeat protein [Candidatus Marinimicrobia bacterium]|nr:tetratricopeptide repeat protein [Candidatus Neomarinimicrobiota bacterium]|tara:strand:- start:1332 stop:3206 length:1875 start_codon:yes stop_codon:yes gene_type:complete